MRPSVPAVEVADHPHRSCRGRPHRERGAVDALVATGVGAERVPQAAVRALADEVQVDVAEGRPEAVRVVRNRTRSVGVGDLYLVRAGIGRELGDEDPLVADADHLESSQVAEQETGLGAGPPDAHHPTTVGAVWPEYVVG